MFGAGYGPCAPFDLPKLNFQVLRRTMATRRIDVRGVSRDAAKCASFYSETGSVMPFNAPIAIGRARVQEVWTQLMAKPGFSLRFAPTQIEVAKSRDMAYDIGTFELKLNDAQGAPMTILGKYVVVWKKQKGGGWKAEADIFNTDK
jgi:ketosteroid isomerase-like protein